MPTVIALDVSLSMSRPVALGNETSEDQQYHRRHLAIHGINAFLDCLSSNCKLEFVSLVAFSYLWEQLSSFSRDYNTIRQALNKVEAFSKTCFESVLNGIKTIVADEWNNTPCQVILVTDGSLGLGAGSLKNSLETAHSRSSAADKFPLPFPFPCKIHIVVVGSPNDSEVQRALPLYQKLINLGNGGGEVFTPDNGVTFKSMEDMFQRIAEKYYSPFNGTLNCGNFSCSVQLFPKPEPYLRVLEDEEETYVMSDKIELLGFMDIKDIGSPPSIARHLVLPRSSKDKSGEGKNGKQEEEEETQDDGKVPSFTVLLHGSLKVESMVAIAKVQENWYGMVYSWADNKKKSNLLLALFEPGQSSVPWIGSFDNLTSCKEYFPENVYSEDEKKSPFPIRPTVKHSYTQSCVVWIKPSGLQSDIQKVLRHARKLPDKLTHFYKELNRTRKAALSFGFLPLLEALASMLDRECTLLPGSAHPNAALQLTHAASFLRSEVAFDASQNILPLQTNFKSGRTE